MPTWFAVKSLYRINVRSSRSEPPRLSSYEERVVLISAADFDEALRKAEDEAREYAADGLWFNANGEVVETLNLEAFNAFALSDDRVGDRTEIHSVLHVVPPNLTDEDLVERGLGPAAAPSEEDTASFEPDFERLAAGEKPAAG
jgi:hypothetical protein